MGAVIVVQLLPRIHPVYLMNIAH